MRYSRPMGRTIDTPLTILLPIQSKHLIWGIAGFGITLRIAQYLHNRSLWVDEAMLVLNLIERSFVGLLTPLDYNQGAPLGFLMVEKLIVAALGSSEYALRLFPLLCGIVSVLLFVAVAKHFVGTKALLLAAGLFAFSYKLIFYSSEVKQYSSDVAISLGLYALMFRMQEGGLTRLKTIAFGLAGAIMIWFSHPAIFILAGIGTTLMVVFFYQEEWAKLFSIAAACLFWGCSFTVFFLLSLHDLGQNTELLNYWRYAFMPLPPTSVRQLRWFDDAFFQIFRDPLGLFPASVAAVTFSIGCIAMAIERREKFFLMVAPILFTLLASGLRTYPFDGRLLLFVAPFIFLCIAEGVIRVGVLVKNKQNLLSTSIASVLLVPQLIYSSTLLMKPYFFEDVKPAIEYISKRWQNGDVLYVYHGAQPTFQFYRAKYGFSEKAYVRGEADRENLLVLENELDALKSHKRLWILFAHIDRSNGTDDVNLFQEHVGNRTLIDAFKGTDAAAYLYDKNDS